MFIHKKEGDIADANDTFSDMYFLFCPVSFYWGCNECRNSSSSKTAAGVTEVARQKKNPNIYIAISTTAAFRKYSQIKSYSDSVKGESFYTSNLS